MYIYIHIHICIYLSVCLYMYDPDINRHTNSAPCPSLLLASKS